MSGYISVPEITALQVQEKYARAESFTLLDVRENFELKQVRLPVDNQIHIPMSKLAGEGDALFPAELRDKSKTVLVLCHHGIRSYQVARWMISLGWKDVYSVRGGIEDWARKIDATIGTY